MFSQLRSAFLERENVSERNYGKPPTSVSTSTSSCVRKAKCKQPFAATPTVSTRDCWHFFVITTVLRQAQNCRPKELTWFNTCMREVDDGDDDDDDKERQQSNNFSDNAITLISSLEIVPAGICCRFFPRRKCPRGGNTPIKSHDNDVVKVVKCAFVII